MEKGFNVALCGATKMAENLGAGWLTTRKAKKRQPLKEKNEGNTSKQDHATQEWLNNREKKMCRCRIQTCSVVL